MQVSLVTVGRVRDTALREACEGYTGRIRRYLRFAVCEVREAGRRAREAAAARQLEGEALRAAVPAGARLFALTREGRGGSSEAFARRLAEWQRDARDVAFVLGGAYGLDTQVLEAAEERLSLSPMTLPHELARLVLLEQLYRACTILRGEPYHKSGDA